VPPPPARLLVVEDNAAAAGALQLLFDANGYVTRCAGGVVAALDAVRALAPDVMILDLTLPDGDGLDVLRALRDGGAPATVALTGHDDDGVRQRCLDSGCRAVAVKPVATQELLALVRSL